MTLEEAIKHCEEVAYQNKLLMKRYDDASGYNRSHNENIRTDGAKGCEQLIFLYQQLAEWLMELQRIKKLLGYLNERPCSGCVFHTENGCCKWDCVFDKDINYEGGKYE